ncbi:MAG: hypothetical protein LAP86_31790 [Acidobacteriia bacterium]|nr:hypothetical protein [Terriglobia bacterium]
MSDKESLEVLVPLVYNELRDIAGYQLQRERSGRSLQSATLVHQTYLRLLDQRLFNTENRAHLLAVASPSCGRSWLSMLANIAPPRRR